MPIFSYKYITALIKRSWEKKFSIFYKKTKQYQFGKISFLVTSLLGFMKLTEV